MFGRHAASGLSCPSFYCDTCGKRIKDVGMAGVSWDWLKPKGVKTSGYKKRDYPNLKVWHKGKSDPTQPLWDELWRVIIQKC